MQKKLLSIAICMAVSSSVAAGTTISTVYTLPIFGNTSSSTLALADFNTNLGNLTSVVLTYTENIQANIDAINHGSTAETLTTTASGSITFGQTNALIYSTLNFSQSDNNIVNNASFASFDLSLSPSGSEILTSANWGDLEKSGGGIYSLGVDVLNNLNFTEPGLSSAPDFNAFTTSETLSGNLTVAYSYNPAVTIAEPDCLLLLAGGIAGLVFKKPKRRLTAPYHV